MKKILNYVLGFVILFLIYYFSLFILKLVKIPFPPAILGLVFFALGLQFKIIKEAWVKETCEFLLKHMTILFIPFIVGLVAYKELLLKNWLLILLIIFLTTSLTIVLIGLFVEYGLKFLRLHKIKKAKNDE